MCCTRLAENTDAKITQKIAICSPSHNFVGFCLRNYGMYQQSEKLVKQQCLPHMSSQYGELRPTNGWDPFGSLGHLQEISTGFASWRHTAPWHSSSGRQPNFAALNRGRHLYSAGRTSRWALAHILVLNFLQPWNPRGAVWSRYWDQSNVCLCVCIITVEQNDLWPRYLAWQFIPSLT